MSTKDNLSTADGSKTIHDESTKYLKADDKDQITENSENVHNMVLDLEINNKDLAEVTTDNLTSHKESDVVDSNQTVSIQKNEEEETSDHSGNPENEISKETRENLNFNKLTKEQLVSELSNLVKNEKINTIKDEVDAIRIAFNAKFNEEVNQKKEIFLEEGGNIIDFYYSTPLKKQFNSIYFDYKEKRNLYYENLRNDQQHNLDQRLELIEELKGLLKTEDTVGNLYVRFKNIQEKWKTIGPIAKDNHNTIWNTYHHHTENFYNFLHLHREFRELDFKYNLEQKLKIIERANELVQEEDVNKAFRELQLLHKIWKEDLGPVDKKYGDQIWDKFSELTKRIHQNRQQYFKDLDEVYEQNLIAKQNIILKIQNIPYDQLDKHTDWQQKIKEIETLRQSFFDIGKVPLQVRNDVWAQFKEAVRSFNRNKNIFYKSLKKEQFDNLNKKLELIKIARDNKDSSDFEVTTPLMKKIQADWKKIGHVPRKESDKIWKQFKDACNSYFDRLHEEKVEESNEEKAALAQKQKQLEELKQFKLSNNPNDDIKAIKSNIAVWKSLGRVPYKNKNIESAYNKVLDQLFKQLNLNKKESEIIKFENKLNALKNDEKSIHSEINFINKKIEDLQNEIRQLETNLQFFKHADETNPMVVKVKKSITQLKENLEVWKEKLIKIKQL